MMTFDFKSKYNINDIVYTQSENNLSYWTINKIIFSYSEFAVDLVYELIYKKEKILKQENEIFSKEEILSNFKEE